MKKVVNRNCLANVIEPHLFHRLQRDQYEIDVIKPSELFSYNRLDLSFRGLYLSLHDTLPGLARDIYYQDIKAQSQGAFVDPDNVSKSGFAQYISIFNEIDKSVSDRGIDPHRSIIPLAIDGSILNGGHRVASAIHHNIDVPCVTTELPPIKCDYQYFIDRAVPQNIVEHAIINQVSKMRDVFVIFKWPSCSVDCSNFLNNIVFQKDIMLDRGSAVNLLYFLYREMDWVGDKYNNYSGIYKKYFECFPENKHKVTITVFHEPFGLAKVREIKNSIRELSGIEFSAVHSSDNDMESQSYCNLMLNENSLHFLRNSNFLKDDLWKKLSDIEALITKNVYNSDDIIIDGSTVMELYGLRGASDLDVLCASYLNNKLSDLGIPTRNEQLVYHKKTVNDLLYNPSYHFKIGNIKFVSLEQLHQMKKQRAEPKDLIDSRLISSIAKTSVFDKKFKNILYNFKFWIYKSKLKSRRIVVSLLKMLGLFELIKKCLKYFRATTK